MATPFQPYHLRKKTKHNLLKEHINADVLFALVKEELGKVKDGRAENASISLRDALMSAFAMFSLKDSSLLAFDKRRKTCGDNLRRVYGIDKLPSDTQMRSILDPIDQEELRPAYTKVFDLIQREKALEKFTFLDGHYLLSGDGTSFFSSSKLKNDKCLTKNSKNGTTWHQMFYGAALVHPDLGEVIPFLPEFIVKEDGKTKNDCEREAAKRFITKFRNEHPDLPVIMIEDGLASNGPHIQELQAADMRFILGAKENDHQHLFLAAAEKEDAGQSTNLYVADPADPRKRHNFFFVNDIPLNKAHPDLKVNFLEYWEITLDSEGKEIKETHFSWVTDIEITEDNVFDIMRGGRARWKIENETFNTLKNQGYHLEHNYGLGEEYLSLVLVTLMMLAFLVDQTQQLCCGLYRAALKEISSKNRFFERVRGFFYDFAIIQMTDIFNAIVYGHRKQALLTF